MDSGLLLQRVKDAGFLGRLVPVSILDDMKAWFDRLDSRSVIFERFPYILHFSPPDTLPDAASLLILATRSPAVRVRFTFGDGEKAFLIPPTYLGSGLRARAAEAVNRALEGTPYKSERALVPVKLLSVMGGLARYGRNNITYYPGLGSYVHLQAFFTTLPPVHEVVIPQMAGECAHCRACVKACPTGAISESRFIIDVERCLTFYNEDLAPCPDWIDPSAHHTLVGCMRCQSACPMNVVNKDFVVYGVSFDADETQAILGSHPLETLSNATVEKLSEIDFRDDYLVFARNLNALANR